MSPRSLDLVVRKIRGQGLDIMFKNNDYKYFVSNKILPLIEAHKKCWERN